MSTARQIKRRIKSIQNISKVTHAMQAVAASKVRHAQADVLASRPYSMTGWDLLINIANQAAKGGEPPHPLLEVREEVKAVGVTVISSDRGLAGPYNTNILRVARRFKEKIGVPVRYIALGRKGRDMLIRLGADIIAEFSDIPDTPSISDIAPIARTITDDFLCGQIDEAYIAYTDFVNTLTQRPVVLRLLPLKPYDTEDMAMSEAVKDAPPPPDHQREYIYEPDPTAVLDLILPRFTEVLIYQAILESKACEHSARMVAMQTASENAEDLAEDLTLEYNKARQLTITREMLDIVGGVEALKNAD